MVNSPYFVSFNELDLPLKSDAGGKQRYVHERGDDSEEYDGSRTYIRPPPRSRSVARTRQD